MIRRLIGKLKINKKQIMLLGLVVISSFLFAHYSHATWVTEVLGWLAAAIVTAMGMILFLLMKVLIYIAQYNNFIRSDAVANGWVIVRDLCNMFFVIILLVISFATILHIENYNYKKWLPKLVMMAILINFSKTICGLIIDFGQVIMLTFVNAFKDIGGGNLVDMLGVTHWQSMQNSTDKNIGEWEVVAAYFLAVIYVIISVIVITTMIAMLIMRMVMLWVYVVLSPAAYLLAAFPGGQKYSSQWWSEFTRNVIVGPVLAFFIWLSFVTLAPGSTGAGVLGMPLDSEGSIVYSGTGEAANEAANQFGTSDLMVKFIISIGMLIGGLKIAQEIGGAAGSIAGKGMAAVNKGAAIGLGGVAAVTGYRYASGVLSSYSSAKKSRRQEKYTMKAGQLTALEANIKGNVKGRIKGAANVAKGTAGDLTNSASAWVSSRFSPKTKEQILQQREAKSAKSKKNKEDKATERENKKFDEEARLAAYGNKAKEYTDEKGVVYKEFKDPADKKIKYRNEETGALATGRDGKEVTKMSDTSYRFHSGLTDGMTRAQALKNQLIDEKTGKNQKLLEAAGTSNTELKRIMNDTNVNKDRRLAAAMTLAIKEGFKNTNHVAGRKDVNNAKNVIGDNQILLKKFDEAVNKKFAHLNFNLDNEDGTVNEAEQNRFKRAMDDGKVNGYGLDNTAYTSANLHKTLENYSGLEYAENISRVAQQSKQARENANEGVEAAKVQDLKNEVPMINDKNELNKFAKLSARIGGDQLKVFRELDGTFNEEAATKYNEGAKANHFISFDTKQLIPVDGNDEDVRKLERAMAKGIRVDVLANMQRAEQNPDLVRRMIGLYEKLAAAGDADAIVKRDSVQDNNILRFVEPIAPSV